MAEPTADDRLADLLLRWEELRHQGRQATAEELCRDCPELLEPLRRQIGALRALDAVLTADENQAATFPLPPDSDTAGGASEEPRHLPPGRTQIPGYEVIGELGRGGMGVVYKARQLSLGRLIALKMILAGAQAGANQLTRFRAEAEAVARLQHPNLIQVFEVGEQEGRPYFVMEFVDGGGLDRLIDGKPQPPRRAAELLETLSRAIQAVHGAGIIHRDLKPSNVLLTADGTAKITDFGLAKRLGDDSGPTLTGDVVGTPSYMAPEQAAGRTRDVGPTTDVYSLGAILYEMLTGLPPVDGETPWDTIQRVVTDDPVAPRRLRPAVPRDLETICLKCLQKEPRRRYPSAVALADDLGRFLRGEPIQARPVGRGERLVKWARRRPAAAALVAVSGLAALLLAAGGVVSHVRFSRALADARSSAEESRRRLVRLNVAEGRHALDQGDWLGSLVWFTEALQLDAGDENRERMHRRRLGAVLRQCPRLILLGFHDGPVVQAQFSRDGRYLITASDDQTARVWDVRTGKAAGSPLRHDGAVAWAAFSPDGRKAVTAGRDATARVWDALTGRSPLPPLRHEGAVLCASFSDDGRRVLTAGEDGTARLWDAATGEALAPPLRHGGVVRCAAFGPDGRRVVTASADRTARVWDASDGEPLTPPLKHDVPVTWAAFDPDGRRVVTACADGTARLWDAASGKPLPVVLRHQEAVVQASFSPDGRRVLTASADNTARVWDAATGEPALAPFQQYSDVTCAAYGPEGRWVVTAGEDNTACLWDTTAISAWRPPLLKHQGTVRWAAFSPDGRRVVTAGNDNIVRVWDVARARRDGVPGRDEPAGPPAPAEPGRWPSPDGRRVVTAEGSQGARVRDASTGQPLGPLLRHGSAVLFAAFCPDGRRVVTASDDDTARVWDAESGELLGQPMKHAGTVRFAAFSPNGELVVTTATDRTARAWVAATGEAITPSLDFGDVIRHAAFEDGGEVVRLRGTKGTEWTLDLHGDGRPVEELASLAGLLSGSRIDPQRGLLPLEADALRPIWEQMRERYPDEFTP
jgi:WD40 repeat protein/predicted Ser/Thr protein kinase